MPEHSAFLSPRAQFKGETPLQTTALAALRAECKYPQLFDAAINEMCFTLLDAEKRIHSQFIGELADELQLEAPSRDGILHEVKKLLGDIEAMATREEEIPANVTRNLCARFLALIDLGPCTPEEFTPGNVEGDIRILKKDRETLYGIRKRTMEAVKLDEPSFERWEILITQAMVAFQTVIKLRTDPNTPWVKQSEYSEVFEFFKELLQERDALQEENDKLIKADRKFRGTLLKLFGEFADPSLSAPEALEETVKLLLDENESLKKDLAEATKRRGRRAR